VVVEHHLRMGQRPRRLERQQLLGPGPAPTRVTRPRRVGASASWDGGAALRPCSSGRPAGPGEGGRDGSGAGSWDTRGKSAMRWRHVHGCPRASP
jgi:hypothetical protein